jgi:hypothetical protein
MRKKAFPEFVLPMKSPNLIRLCHSGSATLKIDWTSVTVSGRRGLGALTPFKDRDSLGRILEQVSVPSGLPEDRAQDFDIPVHGWDSQLVCKLIPVSTNAPFCHAPKMRIKY